MLLLPSKLLAQNDSCHLRISILTCAPGEELYATFGHSAIRITDSASHNDIVYNYGTFNFDEPGFYMKFIRGKLSFYLSTEDYDSFIADYREDQRNVTEQELQLSCNEKNNVATMLEENMMAQNRTYKYDFTFDNCTTRLRDLVEKSADTSVRFGKVVTGNKTFRDLIYEYLDKNDKQWSKLGIDILLGARMDVVMSPRQAMFLPDYLMKTLDSTTIDSRPLVAQTRQAVIATAMPVTVHFFSGPLFIGICLFVWIALLSFSKITFVKRLLAALDGLLFFVTGLLGILLVVMWFGTDHYMCKDNYNLLWAWPTHAVAAFYMYAKKRPATRYFMIYSVFSVVLIGCWFFLPQHLNPALLPFTGLLLLRSILYTRRQNKLA